MSCHRLHALSGLFLFVAILCFFGTFFLFKMFGNRNVCVCSGGHIKNHPIIYYIQIHSNKHCMVFNHWFRAVYIYLHPRPGYFFSPKLLRLEFLPGQDFQPAGKFSARISFGDFWVNGHIRGYTNEIYPS